MGFLFLTLVLALSFGLFKLIELIEYKVFKREKREGLEFNSNFKDKIKTFMSDVSNKYPNRFQSPPPPSPQSRSYSSNSNYGNSKEDLIKNVKKVQDYYGKSDKLYDFINSNYDGSWENINRKLVEKYPLAFN